MSIDDKRKQLGRRPIKVVELDLNYCRLRFGQAPCTAVGAPGTECFQTFDTCPVPEVFDLGEETEGASIQGSQMLDESANALHLSLAGAPSTPPTVAGTAAEIEEYDEGVAFGAINATKYLEHSNSMLDSSGRVSFFAKFRVDPALNSSYRILFGWGDGGLFNWNYLVVMVASYIYFITYNRFTNQSFVAGAVPLAPGFHSIYGIRETANTVRIGIDNTYDSGVQTIPFVNTNGTPGGKFFVGQNLMGAMYSLHMWIGTVKTFASLAAMDGAPEVLTDETAFYKFDVPGNPAFSVGDPLNDQALMDSAPGARHLAMTGDVLIAAPLSSDAPTFGYGAEFPGTGVDFLELTEAQTDPLEVVVTSFGALIDWPGPNGNDQTIWGIHDGSAYRRRLFIRDADSKLVYEEFDGMSTVQSAAFAVPVGISRIGFIKKADNAVDVFANIGSAPLSFPAVYVPNDPSDCRARVGEMFEGKIYSIHWWNIEKTKSEVLTALGYLGTPAANDPYVDEAVLWKFEPALIGQSQSSMMTYHFIDPHSDINLNELGGIYFPCIKSVDLSPTILDPERGLGERAKVSVTLRDFPYHDRGIDPYAATRPYNQEAQGTFFSRLFARNRTSFSGRTLRVRVGYVEPDGTFDLANFETRIYEVERVEGPTKGIVKITAKDPLKRASEVKAQAPFPSEGSLSADISESDLAATLIPLNVGAKYPGSGFMRIGSEVVYFTRTGDALDFSQPGPEQTTVDGRGQYNTAIAKHSQNDTAQLCLRVDGRRVHDIIHMLLTSYAGVQNKYIDKPSWDFEAQNFLIRQYSALITEPTGVDQLIKELTEQAPFYIWWDERAALIKLRALKPVTGGLRTLDENSFIGDSVVAGEDYTKRISQVWVYFGKIDPTTKLEEPRNYQQLYVQADLDSESRFRYNEPKIKKVFSRWITRTNKPAAQDLANNLITRYGKAPRILEFKLDAKDGQVWTGDIFYGRTREVVGFDGLPEPLVMQITQSDDTEPGHGYSYKALEFKAAEIDDERVIIISADNDQPLNIRQEHDNLYGAPVGAVDVTVIVEPGVVQGSSNRAFPAMTTGTFPMGSTIKLFNHGRIQGAGGKGGRGSNGSPSATGLIGEVGGDALQVTFPVEVMLAGEIWGGGGGGRGGNAGDGLVPNPGGGGGGGAGMNSAAGDIGGAGGPPGIKAFGGSIAKPGKPGSRTSGGVGGAGQAEEGPDGFPGRPGGGPGENGVSSANTAGRSVVGNDDITWTDPLVVDPFTYTGFKGAVIA